MIKKWNQNNMTECDKGKDHSSKLHMIYISFNPLAPEFSFKF